MTRYCPICKCLVEVREELIEIFCCECGQPLRDGEREFDDETDDRETDLDGEEF